MTNELQTAEVPGQTTLLDIEFVAVARSTDPDTSHEAAASLSDQAISDSQQRVLDMLGRWGSMSDTALVESMGSHMSQSGIRTRRRELTDLGLVRDSGQRTTLKSGRQAIVWEVVT